MSASKEDHAIIINISICNYHSLKLLELNMAVIAMTDDDYGSKAITTVRTRLWRRTIQSSQLFHFAAELFPLLQLDCDKVRASIANYGDKVEILCKNMLMTHGSNPNTSRVYDKLLNMLTR